MTALFNQSINHDGTPPAWIGSAEHILEAMLDDKANSNQGEKLIDKIIWDTLFFGFATGFQCNQKLRRELCDEV